MIGDALLSSFVVADLNLSKLKGIATSLNDGAIPLGEFLSLCKALGGSSSGAPKYGYRTLDEPADQRYSSTAVSGTALHEAVLQVLSEAYLPRGMKPGEPVLTTSLSLRLI